MNDLAHGELHIEVEGSLLIIDGQGPWNLNAIDICVVENDKKVTDLYGKPWGVLFTAKGDAILVPEARNKLIEIIKQERKKGRVATALTIEHCSVPLMVEAQFKDLYTSAGDEYAFFTSKAQAKLWLQQQLEQESISLQ